MALSALWVLMPSGQRSSGEWIDDTLRRRAEEQGLLARTPLAGRFPRHRVEVIRDGDRANIDLTLGARPEDVKR